MKNTRPWKSTLFTALLCATGLVAKVSDDQVARLDKDLTPMGAIRAANAEGTIPEWTGGLSSAPAPHAAGTHYTDPYAEDKVLFTITAENLNLYRDKLSEGQIALFERYPETWKMNVYETRRSAAFPSFVYDAVKKNAASAELVASGNGVHGAGVGPAFPIPQNGSEAIWNHLLRYIPPQAFRVYDNAAPTADGSFDAIRIEEKVIRPYNQEGATIENTNNKLAYFMQTTLAPAYRAGGVTIIHEPIDQSAEPRQAWSYSTGTRRVRRAPNLAFDNPLTNGDGQANIDDFDIFNGSPERYNWTLVGRQEMYVPYNSYKLASPELKVTDIVRKGHVNTDHTRYELHRVWVVDANLMDGASHSYSRRTFYLDEDSWQILASDIYDARGKIWRVAEAHPINYYDIPLLFCATGALYDLTNGRYYLSTMYNEGTPPDFTAALTPSDFTPQKLRIAGRR